MTRINANTMSVDATDSRKEMNWLGQYDIQPRGEAGRAITVPQTVASEVNESVVVGSGYADEDGVFYLKLSMGHPVEAAIDEGEVYLGNRSVVPSGRGSRVVIPSACDESQLPVGSEAVIGACYYGGELAHLKIIPKQMFYQAVVNGIHS
jgi:hypothetical protein